MDDILRKLTEIVEAQQRQIDDVHRLLVNLAEAVITKSDLAAALDRHSDKLQQMMDQGEKMQRELRQRMEQRRAEALAARGGP